MSWRKTSSAAVSAGALACLLLTPAAQAQTFTFTGQGLVTPAGPPVGPLLPLTVLNTSYDFPGAGSWLLSSLVQFDLSSLTGTGIFTFSSGADSLSGTLSTVQGPVAGGPGFEISYTVASGTGLYAGLSGSGSSVVRLLADPAGQPPFPYLEAGIISLVPEPAAAALMLLGVAGLLLARKRGD